MYNKRRGTLRLVGPENVGSGEDLRSCGEARVRNLAGIENIGKTPPGQHKISEPRG